MRVFIDTNVLVYDTIENSPHHTRASELIDSSDDPIINSLSIVELGFVLPRYGIDNDNVRKKIDELLHSEYFTISWLSGRTMGKVTKFMVENNLSFRDFNDWIIAYDAYSRNIPLVTFDKILYNKCKKLSIQVIEI
ncbi:PIN domain-containing protein [Cuniculiplasma sp. SKW3]|uniref:PIN domain-containing protein n=1 Tax=unclassified Cuniculiplasma TaxID=2619706 RepID=UPI003FCF3783